MKKESTDLITVIMTSWPAVMIALFGGFVKIMMTGEQKLNVKFAIGSLCAAGFVGLLVCLLLHEADIPESIKGFVVGICGASAESTLALLQKKGQEVLKRVLR